DHRTGGIRPVLQMQPLRRRRARDVGLAPEEAAGCAGPGLDGDGGAEEPAQDVAPGDREPQLAGTHRGQDGSLLTALRDRNRARSIRRVPSYRSASSPSTNASKPANAFDVPSGVMPSSSGGSSNRFPLNVAYPKALAPAASQPPNAAKTMSSFLRLSRFTPSSYARGSGL